MYRELRANYPFLAEHINDIAEVAMTLKMQALKVELRNLKSKAEFLKALKSEDFKAKAEDLMAEVLKIEEILKNGIDGIQLTKREKRACIQVFRDRHKF